MRPLHDRVIIEPDSKKTISSGGLYIPDSSADECYARGTVVAVGEGKFLDSGERIPVDVSVGDRVIYLTKLRNYDTFTEVEFDGNKCLIVREAAIICVEE